MADQEQLAILKQGVKIWNQWRQEHPDIHSDLFDADLSHADLSHANLSDAFLNGANLNGATLSRANLNGAHLIKANLSHATLNDAFLSGAKLFDADLSHAFLIGANLSGAHLFNADLSGANLWGAHLSGAFLIGANLSGAHLIKANLSYAYLSGADLKEAKVSWTLFADVDLSTVRELDTVEHGGPSTIGIDTIIRSQGKIPESFLRKAGVPPSIIEAIPSLIGSLKPIDYYSCFISYSSEDKDFAERLYADLQSKGVRCWFAPEDLNIGDKLRPRIDESIRTYEKLLLVLSEHSIASTWVAYEVERALNKEPEGVPNVLYPIRLDDTVMGCKTGWAEDIRRTRHIGDFTHWKEHDAYQKALHRLLRALKQQAGLEEQWNEKQR